MNPTHSLSRLGAWTQLACRYRVQLKPKLSRSARLCGRPATHAALDRPPQLTEGAEPKQAGWIRKNFAHRTTASSLAHPPPHQPEAGEEAAQRLAARQNSVKVPRASDKIAAVAEISDLGPPRKMALLPMFRMK